MNLSSHSNSCHNPNQNQNQIQPTGSTATTTVCLLSPSSPLHSSTANAHFQQTTNYKVPIHLNQLSPSGSTLATKTVIDLNESNNSNYLETSCCSSSSSLNSHEQGANAAATKPAHSQQKLSTKVHGIRKFLPFVPRIVHTLRFDSLRTTPPFGSTLDLVLHSTISIKNFIIAPEDKPFSRVL